MVRAGADFSSLTNATKKGAASIQSMQKSVSRSTSAMSSSIGTLKSALGALGVTLGAYALISFGKSALKAASDLQEIQNVVDVTFGTGNKAIENFADSALKNYGLAELAAKKYVSSIGAMGKSMGFASGQNEEMSKTITGLIGDFASFRNVSTGEAYNAMAAIYTGETETLKKYGILITETNLQEYARTQGITKSISAMTQQEKVLLRYNYVLSVTSDAQGDFVRTQDSWANQTRVLSGQFEQLKSVLGTGLIQALTPVVKMLNTLMGTLINFAKTFSSVTGALFGKQASVATGSTDAVESTTDAVDGLTDSTEASGKAAKKAANSLAGIDELNVLSKDSTSGAGSASGALGDTTIATPSFATTADTSAYEAAAAKIKAAFEPLQKINLDNLKKAFDNLKTAVTPIKQDLFAGLKWAWDNIFIPFSTWVAEDAAPAFLNALAAASNVVSAAITALKPLGQWLWDNFLKPIAVWTGGVIVSTLNALAVSLKAVSDWCSNNQETVRAITIAITAFFLAWEVAELAEFVINAGGVVAMLAKLKSAIVACTVAKVADKVETLEIIALYAKDFIAKIAASIVKIAAATAAWIANTAAAIANKVAMVASTVAQWAMTAAVTAWNVICAVATTVTAAFGAAVAFLTSPIGLVVLAIAALVAGIVLLVKHWDDVKQIATSVWDKIKEIWGGVSQWFDEKVAQPLKKVWDGLWGGIKAVLNSMIKGVEGWVNGFIWGINVIISGINKILKLGGAVAEALGFGGIASIPKLSTVSIPRLASGAVIPPNDEFFAILGDQKSGTNIEAPLDTIVEAFKTALTGMGGNSQNGGYYVFELDSRPMAAKVTKRQNANDRMLGRAY